MAPTLQGFVPSVVGQVVVFVLLKEVGSVHLVAALHQTLKEEKRTVWKCHRLPRWGLLRKRVTEKDTVHLRENRETQSFKTKWSQFLDRIVWATGLGELSKWNVQN